ncbi:glycoside hydrolase family 72 protein [Thermothelomyces thermophilus ATCC 42464]|uniref:1,3-beta-glucanosyltransferase n=1 Tax=Thermothelomyces thermophilus (strain ATCC 42464 / BCRC 31852 / DSM 1799) TaxID=573729 RepID=G2QG57_THET4|nr:glycoside hydrolase family 72 protein [Thermothelomyces thermophilus ATCC 42464]AEO58522.1 glycoside hydrolase family 72 protein [Thermothelomyces thermophilus ATCC 42464]
MLSTANSPKAPSLKAAVRDLHAFRGARSYRHIPLAYSAANVPPLLLLTAEYLTCTGGSGSGSGSSATIDLLGLNIFEATPCASSTWTALRAARRRSSPSPSSSPRSAATCASRPGSSRVRRKGEGGGVRRSMIRGRKTTSSAPRRRCWGPDVREHLLGRQRVLITSGPSTPRASSAGWSTSVRGGGGGQHRRRRRRDADARGRVRRVPVLFPDRPPPACPTRDQAEGWLVDADEPLPTIDGLVIGTVTVEETITGTGGSPLGSFLFCRNTRGKPRVSQLGALTRSFATTSKDARVDRPPWRQQLLQCRQQRQQRQQHASNKLRTPKERRD